VRTQASTARGRQVSSVPARLRVCLCPDISWYRAVRKISQRYVPYHGMVLLFSSSALESTWPSGVAIRILVQLECVHERVHVYSSPVAISVITALRHHLINELHCCGSQPPSWLHRKPLRCLTFLPPLDGLSCPSRRPRG
jgi:hypothetical protein